MQVTNLKLVTILSPPVWVAWIEMDEIHNIEMRRPVATRMGGVD